MLVINRYPVYPELIKLREGFKVWFPGVNVIIEATLAGGVLKIKNFIKLNN